MNWLQLFKVDQDVVTSFVEGTGFRDLFVRELGYPSIPYMYICGEMFVGGSEFDAFQKQVGKNLAGETDRALKRLNQNTDAFVSFGQSIASSNWAGQSDMQLTAAWKQFIDSYRGLVGLAVLPVFFEDLIEAQLETEIEKQISPLKNPKEYEQVLESVFTLQEDTFGYREKRALLEIALEARRNPAATRIIRNAALVSLHDFGEAPDFGKELAEHTHAWGWINVHILEGEPFSIHDNLGRLREMLESDPATIANRLDEKKRMGRDYYNQLMAQYPEFKTVAELAQRIMLVRDYRFALCCKGGYLCRPLMAEIGKRLGLDYRGVLYLLPSELEKALSEGLVDKQSIRQRQEGYAFIVDGDGERLVSGDGVKRLASEQMRMTVDASEIRGMSACKGIARGTVKIISGIHELYKIEKGDILIAQQTVPDFTPAMHKAVAIVTDLGGITSHAAIVSRELGIPCVVGTKTATLVFKDNDVVEVDANKAIVRRI